MQKAPLLKALLVAALFPQVVIAEQPAKKKGGELHVVTRSYA